MDERTLQKKLKFIDDYFCASNASTGSKYDSNANVTCKNLSTLTCELSKKDLIDIHRALVERYLRIDYGEEIVTQYREDVKNHIIYPNDESSIFPYCCSISLYPFVLDGLKPIGGTSGAPKHANSFIGGLVNLVYMVASQFAGAVAIPEFLCYFDHFLRVDYGENYIEHLDEPLEVWGNLKSTLRDKIEDWFQQLIHSINEPAGARNYQSPFTNIAYFDKYYFASIFKDFIFPDGDEPKFETTKELEKMFMKWFNKEREVETLTFPVETANILVENRQYKDTEMADFFAEMWSEGHSFFMYQSDSVDALASCCRLRNEVENNVFSYTLGAGGIQTGSKNVITLNLNRIVQNWDREGKVVSLADYIATITKRVHKYLNAWNSWLWHCANNSMLPIYKAGFIDLDKQFLTVGVNGFVEGAEYLGIKLDPRNVEYQNYAKDILGTIKKVNAEDRSEHARYNTECVPGENLSVKLYAWDKADGYKVPAGRNLYNSYFYVVEDPAIDPAKKFYYQGNGFATECDGGVALHNNLDEILSKKQYRHLMDIAVDAGCNYFTYNIPATICNECGFRSKHYYKQCPECSSKNLDYETRIIGYLKRISNFSEARQIEASKRAYGTLAENPGLETKEITEC